MLILINILDADRLQKFYIDVSSNKDGSSAQICAFEIRTFESSETRVYTCRNHLKGRYVRIRFDEKTRQVLQLCEVQVQGTERFL